MTSEPAPIWQQVLRRFREEPVLLFTLGASVMTLVQGLVPATGWFAIALPVAILIFGFLARELVVPSVKIVEPLPEAVAEPYYGEDQDIPLTPIDQDE